MNKNTRDIATLTGISLDDARKVHAYIDDNWLLHWGTCTQTEFERVAHKIANFLVK